VYITIYGTDCNFYSPNILCTTTYGTDGRVYPPNSCCIPIYVGQIEKVHAPISWCVHHYI
jgi:hypothetical protein